MATADEVANALEVASQRLAVNIVDAITKQGQAIEADVKRRASRPRTAPSVANEPPRLQTGDYNRSIGTRVTRSATRATASVGTNKVQGYRLEKGFDAPGQHTLPHPHFGPALDAAEESLMQSIGQAIAKSLR